MYLLELESGYKILVDCGTDMKRERGSEDGQSRTIHSNSIFPFEPSEINVVLLTHAHIDHSGNLPNLIREGYEGQILCTTATMPLTQLLLEDSAALNQQKIKALHSNGSSKKRAKKLARLNMNEMYLNKQVEETAERFVTLPYHRKFTLTQGVSLTFIPTGHLLGAANIYLEIQENGQRKTIGFSGDIGRKNYPLLPDPDRFPEVDYLVCESTYGNRFHRSQRSPEAELADIIQRTCIDIPGRLIIPAFSIGRTQALLYTLNRLYTEHGFPTIKVFSDSPLALKSTKVYEKFVRQLNQEAQDFYEENEELFDFASLEYVENIKQSKAISNHYEPCIIVSSSGMVRGGRVEHHIKANLENPYCTILMIGYAVEGTLGHQLLQGGKNIRIGKEDLTVKANVESTDVFSGHGDLDDLTEFVQYQPRENLKKLFLVHGDYESMVDFKAHLEGLGYTNVEMPAWGKQYILE
jgi:metallo-beta-lactamase family protein